ncbi:hypothetical protein PF004_g9613 [Phytophthora fragariae]|uniref:Uncharacterized protein n=1 Tax=Phytophthora fragariae TaxID=53985 RepID=A0A6G0P3J0_9STRA|nr:hypothetical protein PF004_g9613 [Phytophthora fragariae]
MSSVDKLSLANPGPITPSLTQTGSTFPSGESSGNASTASFGNSRSSEHTRAPLRQLGITTETQIIVRTAPIALGAAGSAKHHADAPIPSDTEEKPPGPASKKHSGDLEAVKDAPASKKPADATEKAKEPPASKKHAKDAGEAKKPPASRKPTVAATKSKVKAKKTPAPPKSTRKAKKLPKKKGTPKESPKALKLPPKRSAVLLPGPHEEVSSGSSDTDTPNPGYVSGANSPVPRTCASTNDHAASANDASTSPPGRSPSPHPSLDVDYEESKPDMDPEDGEVE